MMTIDGNDGIDDDDDDGDGDDDDGIDHDDDQDDVIMTHNRWIPNPFLKG